MKHRLTLDYKLGEGGLQPYLDGLRSGHALAARCLKTNRASFPPTLPGEWVELSGRGTITARTDGSDGSFALVKFDGADNQAVARLENPDRAGTRVNLVASRDGPPALRVAIMED